MLSPEEEQKLFLFLEPTDFQTPDTCFYLEPYGPNIGRVLGDIIDLNADGVSDVIVKMQNHIDSYHSDYWVDIYSFGNLIVAESGINDEKGGLTGEFKLSNPYPNPFNTSIVIPFEIYHPGNVKIAVYDIVGHEVAVVTDKYYLNGKYSLSWNAVSYSSGLYLIKMRDTEIRSIVKVLLIK